MTSGLHRSRYCPAICYNLAVIRDRSDEQEEATLKTASRVASAARKRYKRKLLRYAPPVSMPASGAIRYGARQVALRAAERLVGYTLRQETMTWEELSSSGRLRIGRHSYGRPTVFVYPGDEGGISIGSFVSIAHGVEVFVGGNHRIDWVSTFPFRFVFDLPGSLEDGLPASKGNIVVGSDVWIGKGAKILSGVVIGDGAVVGAYSVVSRSVRPYAVVVGNPAREVKRRFTDEHVDALQRAAWWDWAMEDIMAAVPLLSSPKVDELIDWRPD